MKNRIPVNEKGTYCITFDNSLYKKAFKLIKFLKMAEMRRFKMFQYVLERKF